MERKWLRRMTVPVIATCTVLANCSGKTTYTPGPPTAFAVVRLTASGAPDATFAQGRGIVTTALDSSSDFALAVSRHPVDANPLNDKILTAGGSGFAGQGVIALVRYNPDGSLDPGFGIGGIVKTPLPSVASTAQAVAVQPDGQIVVAALTFAAVSGDNTTATTGIALLRYNSNGTLDTAGFGAPQGFVTAQIGPGFTSDTCGLVLQSDGKIVVAGAASRAGDPQSGDLVVYRYDSSGVLDPAFGTAGSGGKTTVHLPALVSGATIARSPAIAHQTSGKIIVATGTDADQVVLRLGTNGVLDTTFNAGTGFVTTDIGGSVNYANAVAVQSNDKIVVAGHSNVKSDTSDISVVRYGVDGALDLSFNSTGIATADLAGRFDNALSLVLQDQSPADSLIVVSGNAGYNGSPQMAVLRYKPDGSLDTSFGPTGEGIVLINVAGPSTVASGNALVLQAVGAGLGILVAGYD